MINLIPPSARRSVVREYWLRVIAIWMFLLGTGCLLVATFLLPTYLLIRAQIEVMTTATTETSKKIASYDISAKELVAASTQAAILVGTGTTTPYSEYMTTLEKISGQHVTIRSFDFSRNEKGDGMITVAGVASTRLDLANFKDVLEKQPEFAAIDLPISNLIKEKDLLFSIQITLGTSTKS